MAPPLIVWKRASFDRVIGLQCPACGRRFELTGGTVSDIEDGNVATPRCPNSQCGEIIDVDPPALGGYLYIEAAKTEKWWGKVITVRPEQIFEPG